jgi:hypothetical protein
MHQLGQQWFHYEIAADTGAAHSVIAEYSNSPLGTTPVDWVQFYTSGAIDLSPGTLSVFMDEIYIAPFADIRVTWNVDAAAITNFRVNMALLSSKSTSQAAAAETVGGQTYPQIGQP